MIQGYILSILFLVLSALMFLQNKYRLALSPVLRFSTCLLYTSDAADESLPV